MDRRQFMLGAATVTGWTFADRAWAASAAPLRLLVLIELRGGNDGLNTVVPVDDGRYRDLRPRLALPDDGVVRWAPDLALHASLAPLASAWQAGELAIVQGVGYAQPDLSHFRSIEIWDTAADSTELLQQGWLARAALSQPALFARFAADGVIVGSADLGPLAGGGAPWRSPIRAGSPVLPVWRKLTAPRHAARSGMCCGWNTTSCAQAPRFVPRRGLSPSFRAHHSARPCRMRLRSPAPARCR